MSKVTEQDKQLLVRVLDRMDKSKTFRKVNRPRSTEFIFDDGFSISRYNGLFRVNFRDETLGYFRPINYTTYAPSDSKGLPWYDVYLKLIELEQKKNDAARSEF